MEQIITFLGWLAGVLMGKRKSFGNVDHYLKNKGGIWAAGRCCPTCAGSPTP